MLTKQLQTWQRRGAHTHTRSGTARTSSPSKRQLSTKPTAHCTPKNAKTVRTNLPPSLSDTIQTSGYNLYRDSFKPREHTSHSARATVTR
eukprot:711352-Amphidinium_carterae.1